MTARFELKNTASGEFMFNLKAGNGEIILTSERYKSKQGALNGIESVRKNAADAHRFEHKTATNGQPYFVLKAANGEIRGLKSMMSWLQSNRSNGYDVPNNQLGVLHDDTIQDQL